MEPSELPGQPIGVDPMMGQMMPQPQMPEPLPVGIKREPDPAAKAARKALVKEWENKVCKAKKHWERPFKYMKEDTDFYMGKQWPYAGERDDRYVANLVQRHVQTRVASLYAKNPKAVAKRRNKLDFRMWNGEQSQLQEAQAVNELTMAQTGGMQNPVSMAIMQDVQEGFAMRGKMDKVAKTLEIVFHYLLEHNNFKTQMKQLVRRTCVTGAGFVKVGYQRSVGKRPEDVEKITDIKEQIRVLETLIQDQQDAKFDENHAKFEQMQLMLKELSEKQDAILDEGLVFDFPQTQNIIVDTRCRQLKGFIGAEWVAQEFLLTLDEVKEVYQVDLGTTYTRQEPIPQTWQADRNKEDETNVCRIWEIYSKRDCMKYVIAEGYPDFLVEPSCPEIKLKRFWPFFTLVFNEVESDRDIYPPSDIRMLRPIQLEYNLARQRLREHRNANRPLYVIPVGALNESDVKKLMDRQPNEVIQLNSLQPGQDVGTIIQQVKPVPIDPTLYDVSPLMEDMFRVVGSQEANLGGTTGSTATEVSVAESSRMSSIGSNVDDLDDFLTELCRSAGQILLTNMDPMTAEKIAGPGASWPTMSAQEIADELMLEVAAGSSGRPNKAAEIANFERLAPTIMQIPGIDPSWFAKEAIRRLDDGLDLTEAIKAAIPSIVAQNAMEQAQQTAMGEPALQGGSGALNTPTPTTSAPGAPVGGTPIPGSEQVPNIPTPVTYADM
jgi:hypothetical protein